ncbi:alpha/beta hydrolase [Rhodococcus spelaei]|uniref:alpha/beta hydrolase n=1 Tax=Rhodococcus spelaei TaxID=2546320 RepID=UPI001FE4F492|nr:alpha/beta hydrolase family protein [Rhodococcus spelaei]
MSSKSLVSAIGRRRRGSRRFGVAVATATVVAFTGGVAQAAPDLGSSGSSDTGSLDAGSLASGSVGAGSSIPPALQEDPGPPPPVRDDITTAAIVAESSPTAQTQRLTVASPALRREVTLDVLLPADRSTARPVLYMLDGVSARNNKSGWMTHGAPEFFADKDTNVVMINGGRGSVYTDWDQADPKLGWNKWETFIAEELPPLIDAKLGTNRVRAVAGLSMGGQAAMMLTHRHPDLYRGVAAFSGCFTTDDTLGRLTIQTSVTSQGGDPTNMWSSPNGPQWSEHDSVKNAEKLRDKQIYLSVGNGIPGKYESNTDPKTLAVGVALEVGSKMCTEKLESRLDALKIPVTVRYESQGIHAWGYWTEQLPKAWPTLRKALGL